LPLARRDIERLRQIISLQRRLKDLSVSTRAQRALAHRHVFRDALTWMEIHGGSPEIVDHWKAVLADSSPADAPPPEAAAETAQPSGRRRRRRRRGRRSRPPQGH
jgi:hypothetical protein